MSEDNKAMTPPLAGGKDPVVEGIDPGAFPMDLRDLLSLAEVSDPSASYKDYVNQVSSVDRIFKIIARGERSSPRPGDTDTHRHPTGARAEPGGLSPKSRGGRYAVMSWRKMPSTPPYSPPISPWK
jgi:hypothetical protein